MDRTKWATAVWAAFRARNLTRTARDVLLNLKGYAVTGTAWPSHETLAGRAGCNPKTVARALQAAKALGLVTWRSGGRWVEAGRWRRASNRYRLTMPETTAASCARLSGHFTKRFKIQVFKERARTVAEQIAALGVPLPVEAGSVDFRRAMGW